MVNYGKKEGVQRYTHSAFYQDVRYALTSAHEMVRICVHPLDLLLHAQSQFAAGAEVSLGRSQNGSVHGSRPVSKAASVYSLAQSLELNQHLLSLGDLSSPTSGEQTHDRIQSQAHVRSRLTNMPLLDNSCLQVQFLRASELQAKPLELHA